MKETHRAYNQGYFAASERWYSKEKPPLPPDECVRSLIIALQELCNAADSLLATIDENDEWSQSLGPHLDNGLAALEQYKDWLRRPAKENL
jgi:hypothetical protein